LRERERDSGVEKTVSERKNVAQNLVCFCFCFNVVSLPLLFLSLLFLSLLFSLFLSLSLLEQKNATRKN